MSDIDSSELFGSNNNKNFSGQSFKNFGGANSSGQPASGAGLGATAGLPNLSPNSAENQNSGGATGDTTKAEYVLNSRLDENQIKEIAGMPFDLFKQFLFGWLPELAPQPTDPAEEKAKKEQHLAKLKALNQETKQIYLQKAQVWKQKREEREAERQAKKRAEDAQKEAADVATPAGKRSGAYDPTSKSQKANTEDLLKRQRQANSDRTQGAD